MRLEQDLSVPAAELVDVCSLRVDGKNPNVMSRRQFESLRKSIQRWGFVVPIITNRDLLVADGEHRLDAARSLGMKQVSVIRLPVDEVDRRMIRQVMNKIRGEHDLFLDAEEYLQIVSEGNRDLLRQMLNESDLRIDNLLSLLQPPSYSDEDLQAVAKQFMTSARALHSHSPLYNLFPRVHNVAQEDSTKTVYGTCQIALPFRDGYADNAATASATLNHHKKTQVGR